MGIAAEDGSMATTRRGTFIHLGLLLVVLVALTPLAVLGQATPAPISLPPATPAQGERRVVWDAVDVTVELKGDSSVHVTERDRVDFHGGPFRSGYRESRSPASMR